LNEFHPNELDPYLLFDARDSMIGTLENPTLDLDPSKPDTLNVITATRAGVATYTDVNGNIATASADTVRVDHVDGVPMILVEPSATNKVPYSEDFSNSSWGKNDITISPAPVAAPDGTMNASHVVKTGSNGTLVKTNIGAANTHTSSIWARTVSGSGTCIFTGNNGVISTVTEEWQRFEVASTNSHMYAVNFRGTSTLTEIYIWGAQLEEGIATSYIPTQNVPVTRAADDLVISGSDFDFYNQSEGTFFATARIRDTESKYALLYSNSSARFMYSNTGNDYVYAFDGSNSVAFSSPNENADSNFALTYSSANSEMESSRDGVYSNTNIYNGNFSTATNLRIGGGTETMSGHIKRVLFWPYHSDSL
jgi:hypothetical protein